MWHRRTSAGSHRSGRSLAVLLSAAAVGGIGVSAFLLWPVREDPQIRRLAQVVGAHRVSRARLIGGFAYAPCDAPAPNDSLVTGLTCERSAPAQWVQARELAKL